MKKSIFLSAIIFCTFQQIHAQSCSAPTAQRVTNRTQNSVDVYWTAGSTSATSWSVEYGLWPLAQSTGTTVTSNNDTLPISSLNAGTPYTFYVRENCPGGGTSNWTGPYNFPTLCPSASVGDSLTDPIIVTSTPYNDGRLMSCYSNQGGNFSDPDVYYRVTTGPQAVGLTIEASGESSTDNTFLRLMDASGTTLIENNDISGANRFSRISRYPVEPNTDYVILSEVILDATPSFLYTEVSESCPAVTAPYIQDFETGFIDGYHDGLDECWTFSSNNTGAGGSGFSWEISNDSASVLSGTGTNHDNTEGPATGGHFATLVVQGSTVTSDSATLLTPFVDLSTLSTPELTYYYHRYGFATFMPDLHVDIYTGSFWTLGVQTISTTPQSSRADAYTKATVDLAAYAGQTIRVRFRAVSKGFQLQGDIALDDIRFDNSCAHPTQLAASSITTTSASLSWTSGGASNWRILVDTVGFTPGGTGTGTSSNPYVATGLSPAADYDFYVRDSCGPGELSFWAGPYTFTTACPPSFTAPYATTLENFNDNHHDGIMRCWDFVSNNTGFGSNGFSWQVVNQRVSSGPTGPDTDHTLAPATGGTFLILPPQGSSSTNDSAMLTSPPINLSGLSSPRLRYYYHRYGTGTFMPDLHVDIHNGSMWTYDAQLISITPQTSSADAYTESILGPFCLFGSNHSSAFPRH